MIQICKIQLFYIYGSENKQVYFYLLLRYANLYIILDLASENLLHSENAEINAVTSAWSWSPSSDSISDSPQDSDLLVPSSSQGTRSFPMAQSQMFYIFRDPSTWAFLKMASGEQKTPFGFAYRSSQAWWTWTWKLQFVDFAVFTQIPL